MISSSSTTRTEPFLAFRFSVLIKGGSVATSQRKIHDLFSSTLSALLRGQRKTQGCSNPGLKLTNAFGVVSNPRRLAGVVSNRRQLAGVVSNRRQLAGVVSNRRRLAGVVSNRRQLAGVVSNRRRLAGVRGSGRRGG